VADPVSLGDDIAAALPELRAQAESLMVDTVKVERETGTTPDPVTLEEVPIWETVYEGKGRWQRPDTVAAEKVAGEVEFGLNRTTIQLPMSAVGIVRGYRATCTVSAYDPDLPGTKATVLAVPNKTHATMRRLLCEEVT
jgi:hypothetical protein